MRRIIIITTNIFIISSSTFAQQKSVTDSINLKPGKALPLITDHDITDEIIDIGYGYQRRNEVTNSISSLGHDDFNNGNINNPEQLFQGKVSGLSLSKPGSNPNEMYYLRLRGLSTINANTQPLVVIDGLPDGDLENIDPNDIESITVLKDGSSSAIYGIRGSGGVILIATKRGTSGKPVIEYNVYTTAEMVSKNTPVMNASEWRALSSKIGIGTDFGASTNWFDEIEQTAISQVHNISMSGGNNNTIYRASVNYRNVEGVLINTGYSKLNGRINITQKALNDKFTLDLNLAATEKKSQYGFNEAFRYAAIYNPTAPVRSSDQEFAKYDGYFQQVIFDYYNPVSILEKNFNDGNNSILNLSVKGIYEIIKDLTIDAYFSVQQLGTSGGVYYDKNDFFIGMNSNGLASRMENNLSSNLFESTVKYNIEINSAININLLGGYSYQDFNNEGFSVQGGNFLTDKFSYNNLSAALDFKDGRSIVDSDKNTNKLIAFFGRLNLNINNLWFITASARYEGSSRLGANKKWSIFPALGGGIDLSNTININWVNFLKLRANYGITGNQPSANYLSRYLLEPMYPVYMNGNFVPGYQPVNNENPDLKSEKKGEFDAGFDFSIIDYRLSGSLDFYTRTTTDLLYQCQVPIPPNLAYSAWTNLGKIKSSGVELTLNYKIVKKSDFSYNIALTPYYNFNNTLVSLSGTFNGTALKLVLQDWGYLNSPGSSGPGVIRIEEGKPIGQIFAYKYKGIDENGNIILDDISGYHGEPDGYIDYYDRTLAGNSLPKFIIGFGNNISYKNWDIKVFFRGVFGHDIVNSFRAHYEAPNMISSYNLPTTAANLKNETTGALMKRWGVFSSKDVENGSFVTLDNISIGYDLKLPETSQFSKIRFYLAGNNLFYITKYKGADPNPRYADNDLYGGFNNNPLVPGIDRRNTWCRTRSFTFGANFEF
ncbi:MAG TPA: SusC/RagA family TonB-linked outer membrane protein [Bacteroidales bacterium]|nr:SusC/RagA family TonB-linked outer membrane protein [Bacteroidales bacterium]